MTKPPSLVITRFEPTPERPDRRVYHRVDQSLWLAVFGRYRTSPTSPSPGQCPNDTSSRIS